MKTNTSNIIVLEGAKNVGKTYLITNSGLPSYKFPFANYFNKFLKTETNEVGTNDSATYHFSTSFDISLLSMAKQGLIKDHLLVDRGFLSNIVLGELQGRITEIQGFEYIDFLYKEGYIDSNLRIIYIHKDMMGAREVAQDQWEYLDANKLHDTYLKYMTYLQVEYNFSTEIFKNNLDEDSVHKFKLACIGSVKLNTTKNYLN